MPPETKPKTPLKATTEEPKKDFAEVSKPVSKPVSNKRYIIVHKNTLNRVDVTPTYFEKKDKGGEIVWTKNLVYAAKFTSESEAEALCKNFNKPYLQVIEA